MHNKVLIFENVFTLFFNALNNTPIQCDFFRTNELTKQSQ
jgi:hypothetical protein